MAAAKGQATGARPWLFFCTFTLLLMLAPSTTSAHSLEEVAERMSYTYFTGVTTKIAEATLTSVEDVKHVLALLRQPDFQRKDNCVAFLGHSSLDPAAFACQEVKPGDDTIAAALRDYLVQGVDVAITQENRRAAMLVPHALGVQGLRGSSVAAQALISFTRDFLAVPSTTSDNDLPVEAASFYRTTWLYSVAAAVEGSASAAAVRSTFATMVHETILSLALCAEGGSDSAAQHLALLEAHLPSGSIKDGIAAAKTTARTMYAEWRDDSATSESGPAARRRQERNRKKRQFQSDGASVLDPHEFALDMPLWTPPSNGAATQDPDAQAEAQNVVDDVVKPAPATTSKSSTTSTADDNTNNNNNDNGDNTARTSGML